MDTELEKLCDSIIAMGIDIELKRTKGGWRCSLHIARSKLFSVPTGTGMSAVEAVNAAVDQRIELTIRDGS